MVTDGFLQPFWNTVRRSSVAVWVDCSQFIDQPIFFWKVSEHPTLTTVSFAQRSAFFLLRSSSNMEPLHVKEG